MCACVFVSEKEKKRKKERKNERKNERKKKERKKERKNYVYLSVRVLLAVNAWVSVFMGDCILWLYK